MKTLAFHCGCSITSSMFGGFEVLSINLCTAHALKIKPEMDVAVKKLLEVTKEDGKLENGRGE